MRTCIWSHLRRCEVAHRRTKQLEEAAWARVIDWLTRMGVEPSRPEAVEGATDPWEKGVAGEGEEATAAEEVDLEALRELRGKAREEAAQPEESWSGAEEWRARVRRSTGDSMRGVPSEWHTGGSKTTAAGSGAHVVQVLGGYGGEVVRYRGEVAG